MSTTNFGLTENQQILMDSIQNGSYIDSITIPGMDTELVSETLNSLIQMERIEVLAQGDKMFVSPRSYEEAQMYLKMSNSEKKIYQLIKATGSTGAWLKNIKDKSQLHSKIVTDGIKSLEKKQIIKSVKSVKAPSKKVYMLYHIEPSTELTGGTWYTDTTIDMGFVNSIHTLVLRYVQKNSTLFKGVGIDDVSSFINTSGVVAMGGLDQSDVQMVLDRLVYDDLVSKHTKLGFFV